MKEGYFTGEPGTCIKKMACLPPHCDYMLPLQIRSQCTFSGIVPLLSEKTVAGVSGSSDTLAKTLASENAAKLN